jgi:hypothetical protein
MRCSGFGVTPHVSNPQGYGNHMFAFYRSGEIACTCQPDYSVNIIDRHVALLFQSGVLVDL